MRVSVRRFVEGEKFLYLGQEYPLALVDKGSETLALSDKEFRLIKYYLDYAPQIFTDWYRRQALRQISKRAESLAGALGVRYKRIRVSNGRSRWGACSARNSLCFNWRLIMASERVIDYVIVHELLHCRIKNHSRRYWSAVRSVMPDFTLCRRWLREYGHTLTV